MILKAVNQKKPGGLDAMRQRRCFFYDEAPVLIIIDVLGGKCCASGLHGLTISAHSLFTLHLVFLDISRVVAVVRARIVLARVMMTLIIRRGVEVTAWELLQSGWTAAGNLSGLLPKGHRNGGNNTGTI